MDTTNQYIKNVIRVKYPTLDISDGSPLSELFINPAAAFLDPVMQQLRYLMDNLGLNDPANIVPEELDAIAANYLITRLQGTKTHGFVEMFFETPQEIDIPVGTVFTHRDGNIFVTSVATHISQASMQQNVWRYPLFSTGNISVYSAEPATITVNPGDIVSTNFSKTPVIVTNTSTFVAGTGTETNTELAARIIMNTVNHNMSSVAGIKGVLQDNFPTIQSMTVVSLTSPNGNIDDRMTRDLYYSGLSVLGSYHVVDYRGKISTNDFYTAASGGFFVRVSGLFESVPTFDTYPYPQSTAYWTLFYDDPTTSGLQPDLPPADEFVVQFTTAQYANIYYLNDLFGTSIFTRTIMDEPFTAGGLDPRWILGDAQVGTAQMKTGDEIQSTTNGVRLGVATSDNLLKPVTIDRTFLTNIKTAIMNTLTKYAPDTAAYIETLI